MSPSPSPVGAEALMNAVGSEELAAVRRLLDAGVAPDAVTAAPARHQRTVYQRTPLAYAAVRGAVEIARLLLERGADPDGPRGHPPLLDVLRDVEMTELLLAGGAHWERGNAYAPHAVAAAAEGNLREAYELLLRHGAPPGYREMATAVARDDMGALRAALASGVWADDALRLCAKRGNDECMHTALAAKERRDTGGSR